MVNALLKQDKVWGVCGCVYISLCMCFCVCMCVSGSARRRNAMKSSIVKASGIRRGLGVAGILSESPGISGMAAASRAGASSERPAGSREAWKGKGPGPSPTESVKWQACSFPTLHPQIWAESKGHSGPSLSQTEATGAVPWGWKAAIPRAPDPNRLVFEATIYLASVLYTLLSWCWKKKELEEWKWEALRDGNSFLQSSEWG